MLGVHLFLTVRVSHPQDLDLQQPPREKRSARENPPWNTRSRGGKLGNLGMDALPPVRPAGSALVALSSTYVCTCEPRSPVAARSDPERSIRIRHKAAIRYWYVFFFFFFFIGLPLIVSTAISLIYMTSFVFERLVTLFCNGGCIVGERVGLYGYYITP
ncbi:hypothetical protein F4774DRAFT_403724 [Daldinia eschscholtzii]|nr:hypothetical protein F4774DRAFT_403724 [Daldinia eschscholtzii]